MEEKMKNLAPFLLALFIFNPAKAYDPNPNVVRQQMVDFETTKNSVDYDLAKIEVQMVLLASPYGNDLYGMDSDSLKAYIANQKNYYSAKKSLSDRLSQIYLSQATIQKQSLDAELRQALKNLAKQCNILNKITSRCLNERETLIFESEYIKQKIAALDVVEAGLTSQINLLIVDNDKQKALNQKF
jgi:hypothetical protein